MMEELINTLKQKVLDCLCSAKDTEAAIHDVLEMMGVCFQMERVYILDLSTDGSAQTPYEWCSKKTVNRKNECEIIHKIFDKDTLATLNQGQCLVHKKTGELPEVLVCRLKTAEWEGFLGMEQYTERIEGEDVSQEAVKTVSEISALLTLCLSDYHRKRAQMAAALDIQKKYEMEKRSRLNDRSTLAYAVFNLRTGQTLEMERRRPLAPLNENLSMERFRADTAACILSMEQREQFLKLFDSSALLKKHEEGIDEQSMDFQRILPGGKVVWARAVFHLMMEPGGTDSLLFYSCSDINLNKSMELMMSYIASEDYDILGCINFQDDSTILLYGKNSSRLDGDGRLRTEEKYTEALEWFVENAIVPEEREQYRPRLFIEKIKQELSLNDNYEFQVHVIGQDGMRLTKQIRYTRYDAESAVCFFTQVDITAILAEEEKKQQSLNAALEEARQANEAKTAFLSRMSHDMRTPMNGVLGLAALMREEADLNAVRRDVEQLEMSGKYLLQLINDTLDMSKIEAGKLELRLKPIDSESVFNNVLNNAAIMAAAKNIQLQVHAPEMKGKKWVRVIADASRLEQVVMNILSNAIKFTPVGGRVDLIMESVSITSEQVVDRYIIRDTGIGISEEFLPHIFESFSQEGRADTGRENGTGLGMSIVHQLVELMGGEISIKSQVGKGTEVTLLMRYPVCHEEESDSGTIWHDTAVLSGKRILLCEDHPLNNQIATRLLEKVGALVEHAENGKIGIELFENRAPGYYDVILMDIRMPVMNGLEAAGAIRALQRSDAKSIPIIAMTANAYEEDVRETLAAGMNAHLSKPIEPEILYQCIAGFLQ